MKCFISVYLETKRHIDIDKVESKPNKWYNMVRVLGEEEQVIVQISDAGGKDPLG